MRSIQLGLHRLMRFDDAARYDTDIVTPTQRVMP
jgi:hypothetical protein